MDDVLSYARPDVERLVWTVASPFGGVVSWSYNATEHDLRGWLTTVDLQVDVRAGRKADAFRRADQVRRAVCGLPWTEWSDGVVVSADVTEGPFWLPDSDGAPRYVARYAVTVHPRPASTQEDAP